MHSAIIVFKGICDTIGWAGREASLTLGSLACAGLEQCIIDACKLNSIGAYGVSVETETIFAGIRLYFIPVPDLILDIQESSRRASLQCSEQCRGGSSPMSWFR